MTQQIARFHFEEFSWLFLAILPGISILGNWMHLLWLRKNRPAFRE